MSQICTNEKQSLRLLSAGVPLEMADMYIARSDSGESVYRSLPNGPLSFWKVQEEGYHVTCTSAFSLSALWDIIHKLDKTYEFPSSLSSEQLIENLVTRICYRREHQ